MADSLYPPRCANCQWSLAAHGAACLCASASNSSACWRKCCEPPTAAVREPSLAVVLQTHGTVTQGLLARIRIAKEQLATHGIRFFLAYTFNAGDDEEARCPDATASLPPAGHGSGAGLHALALLATAVPRDALWCISMADFTAVWPKFSESMRSLPPRSVYARHLPNFHHNSSRDAWAWIACDLHAQVGAWLHLLKFGRHPPFDFLWTIDADVAWTGNLGRILESLNDDDSDLITSEPAERNRATYTQAALRNHLEPHQVWSAMLVVVRYSRRMLVAIRESVGAGHQSFCETRAPSLCRAWGMDWCRHSSLRTRRPDLLSREFGCCNVVTVGRAFELGAKWEATPAAERGVGQFIHRLRRDAA